MTTTFSLMSDPDLVITKKGYFLYLRELSSSLTINNLCHQDTPNSKLLLQNEIDRTLELIQAINVHFLK